MLQPPLHRHINEHLLMIVPATAAEIKSPAGVIEIKSPAKKA
jgi:hypothetical protein